MKARLVLFLLALISLAACSSKDNQAASKTGASARPQYQAVADVPPELRAQFEDFGKQLEKDMREKNVKAVRTTFDDAAIVDAICSGTRASSRNLSQFKAGLQRGIQTGLGRFASMWSGPDAKFKGLAIYQGNPAARFRFVSDDHGVTLVDFVLHKNPQGKLCISGFCNHAMGYDIVEQGRQTAAPMLAELDKSFLQRLVDRPNLSSRDLERFGELSKKAAAGDAAGAIAAYKSLPPALKDTLAATGMYIGCLQRAGDNEGYKAALKEAAAKFKSANFEFMLVDLYFLEKQYDKAVGCLDAFMQAIEKDAALLTLRGLLLNAKGDVPGARACLRDAFALEPDCVYAHMKGLDVLLAAKDFPAVRDSLVFLEKERGYEFKGAMTDPLWNDFKKSPESARWR